MQKKNTEPNNSLMEALNIKDKKSKKRPSSVVDKSIVNMQLEIAKIIMKDAYAMQIKYP